MDRDRAMRGNRSAMKPTKPLRPGHPSKRAAVTNIDYDTTFDTLKAFLRDTAGVDLEFAFIFNGQNGPKGKGFADFRSEADRDKAIELCHREKINDREIYVRKIDPEFYAMYGLDGIGGGPPKPGPGFSKPGPGFSPHQFPGAPSPHGFSGASGFSGGSQNHFRQNFNGPSGASPSPLHGARVPTGPVDIGETYGLNMNFLQSLGISSKLVSRVFVTNLNTSTDPVTEKLLTSVFRCAGKILSLEMKKDQDGQLRNIAHIEYLHPVEAVQAISMFHGQELNGRPMNVRMDLKYGEFDPSRLPPGLKGVGLGLGGGGKPLTEVSASLNSSGGSVGGGSSSATESRAEFSGAGGASSYYKQPESEKLSDTIIINNLPAYMDEQGLKASFSLHGQILFCEIRAHGIGIIRYSSDTEATRCIMMMDKQRLGNNILDVAHFTMCNY